MTPEKLKELCHRLDTENTATDPQKCADTMDEARLALLSLIGALEAAEAALKEAREVVGRTIANTSHHLEIYHADLLSELRALLSKQNSGEPK